jgi:hypothetical protein
MNQFDDGDGGESCLCVAVCRAYALEDLPNTLTATLRCNKNAGVEDYSHAERSRGMMINLEFPSRLPLQHGEPRPRQTTSPMQ